MRETVTRGASVPIVTGVPRQPSVTRRFLDAEANGLRRSRLARFFGASPLSPAARSLYAQAQTEVAIVREFAKLGPEWTLMRQVGRGNDHAGSSWIFVGKGGAFYLSVVDQPNQDIWVDDFVLAAGSRRSDLIARARDEAKRLSTFVSADASKPLRVVPLVVVTAAKSITYATGSNRVIVLDLERLARWLSQRPTVISQASLLRVRSALFQISQPLSGEFVSEDALECIPEFELLDHRVRQAQKRLFLSVELTAVVVVVVAVLLAIF